MALLALQLALEVSSILDIQPDYGLENHPMKAP